MVEVSAAIIFSTLFIFASAVVFGAPFIPSFPKTVKTIMRLSGVKKGEKVVDLGSGDGRILLAFARKGIEAHGYEINPILVGWSWLSIRRAGLNGLAHVHFRSYWGVDLREFDVVVVYGVSGMMKRLEKKLKKELKKGSRVVSAIFNFPGWLEEKEEDGVFVLRITEDDLNR